jgi:DivIVA domain-containing protein
VDLDRQSIERRDFPISRRGYDPAAVDAHLSELAADVNALERALDDRAGESLGSTAGSQVQSILEAAEATAADIEQQAAAQAAATRQAADRDAAQTRSEAVARAQAHVQAVSQATAVLLEKVEAMDQEVGALVQSLRAGAGRLASDLRAVEVNMGELYDAAAGSAGSTDDFAEAVAPEPSAAPELPEPEPETTSPQSPPARPPVANGSAQRAPAAAAAPPQAPSGGGDDLDGARLIALNMALNGEPREQADRYLAERFDLADRDKLLDEVYAAIDG